MPERVGYPKQMNLTRIGQSSWIGSAILAALVFGVTLGGAYIYDDHGIILQDPRIAQPSRWAEFLTHSYNNGPDQLYRPLVSLSYAVQWWLHGDRAWAFHLVNLLLHAGVSALVAILGLRLLGSAAGWIAGALFAVHPIHVEAVAGIVGRAELMCAAGMVGAMVLLLRPVTSARAIGIAGCFLIAALSKEQGMLLPPLLAGLWWARADDLRKSDDRHAVLLLAMLLLWLLAGYIVWRETVIGFWWDRQYLDWTLNPMVVSPSNPSGGSIGADRWLMPLALLGRYTVMLVAPIDLRFEYGGMVIGPHVELGDPYLWIGIFAAVLWAVIAAVSWRKRNRVVLFLTIALLLTYGMIGNIIALIGVNFAERLIYIPSVFFVLLISASLLRLPRRALIPATAALVLLGGAISFTYAHRWNNEIHFYETGIERQPQSIRLRMLLVDAYRQAGRLDDAARVAAEARQVEGDYWETWWLSGVVALDQGHFDEAQAFFERSLAINGDLKVSAWLGELSRRRAAATTRAGN